MRFFNALRRSERSLKGKLFAYMFLLVLLLLLALMAGLFLLGRYMRTEKDTYYALDVQMDVFEKAVSSYFDHLAAASIQLAESTTATVDAFLQQSGLDMAALSDHETEITALQDALIGPLKQKLLQENCSGAFLLLEATVNSGLDHASVSRTGLYLQTNGYEPDAENVLLYRGDPAIAKQHDIMPHRKWHLEFNTAHFPDYDALQALANRPADEAYLLTTPTTLPGTSEQVILMAVPLVGSDGTYYGICGFEVSASYFMSHHAQPTKLAHLTCLLTISSEQSLDADKAMSCGAAGGYYRAPHGTLTIEPADGALLSLVGDSTPYIGVTRQISLSPNNELHTLAVMMLQEDYDQAVHKATLQNIILCLLILFFAVNCSYFFSRRFLAPLLRALEQLKSDDPARSNIQEIDDLFEFLSEKDREYDETLQELTLKVQQAQRDLETAQSEITRLSYKMKQEVDPEAYQFFLNGLQDLTPTEHKVFTLYFEGKSAKEILEILQIKENTLKFHNKGIYSKLGVNSRKQLLQYAALLKEST